MRFPTSFKSSRVSNAAMVLASALLAQGAQAQNATTTQPKPATAPAAAAATAAPVAAGPTAQAAAKPATAVSAGPSASTSGSASAATPAPATGTVTAPAPAAATAAPATTTLPTATTAPAVAAAPLTKVETKVEAKVTPEEPAGEPLWTGTARFADRYYEVGITAGSGGLLFAKGAESVGLTGIRVYEHQGYISKAAVTIAVALGQRNSEYVGSTYHSDGRYTYRTDYYRPLTPQERAAQAQQLADAINGEYTTEFTYYSSNMFGLGGTGAGFEMSLGGDLSLGTVGGLPAILTLGGYGAYITAPAVWQDKARTNAPSELSFTGFGMMARAHIPIHPMADALVEWDANLASLFDSGASKRETEGKLYGSPLKLGGYLHLTDRGYVKAQAVLGGFGFSDGKLGYQAELGVRF